MFTTSSEFKQAVADGHRQHVRLVFDYMEFRDWDVDIETPLHFEEHLNLETNILAGQCPSSEISFRLFNENQWLKNFSFGKFQAMLGVELYWVYRVPASEYTAFCPWSDTNAYYGHRDYRLLFNGNLAPYLPSFVPYAIHMDMDKLKIRCFADSGACEEASLDAYGNIVSAFGSPSTWSVEMNRQAAEIARRRDSRYLSGFVAIESQLEGAYIRAARVEYAPLGVFIAPRPAVVVKQLVDVEANDQMTLFDATLPDSLWYGETMTAQQLLDAMCTSLGVVCSTLIPMNGNLTTTKPDNWNQTTYREALRWIGELSCTYARFDRIGRLELVWFSGVSVEEFSESGYADFTPSWYLTKMITALHVRNANSTAESIDGSGAEKYLIQNNPFLRIDDSGGGAT